MKSKIEELRRRLTEAADLNAVVWLLEWDQATYMPPGGAEARARQSGLLARLAHERATEPAIGRLLDELQPWAETLPYDSFEASLVRVTRREYERKLHVPSEFMADLIDHQSRTYAVWAESRPNDEFAAVRPYLERMLDLSRQYSDFFPGCRHVADPLIANTDQGMDVAILRELFDRLRGELVPLVKAIAARPLAEASCLRRTYSREGQRRFFEPIVRAFGFDDARGRQDVSPHPFTTNFSISDVRFTVYYVERDLSQASFSAFHEAGHALYEQGIDPTFEGTPLAVGTSAGLHESQSRLWENVVGRSRPFWSYYYPHLQAIFPQQLADVSLEDFYRAVNRVQPSALRFDADEVTYDLHILIRFALELELLEGSLEVRHLPEAWATLYQSDLGVTPPDDRDGVMQDVHWYAGPIGGAFQGYTLGNIMAAQFYDAAVAAHPEIEAEMAQGRFDTLHRWLRDEIYRHGSKYTAAELVERVTGGPLRIEPYLRYLRSKYGELYGL